MASFSAQLYLSLPVSWFEIKKAVGLQEEEGFIQTSKISVFRRAVIFGSDQRAVKAVQYQWAREYLYTLFKAWLEIVSYGPLTTLRWATHWSVIIHQSGRLRRWSFAIYQSSRPRPP